jgi:hypothetical protein
MARDFPPHRLVGDPEVSEGLRSLLDHARGDVPEPSTLARFTARLDAAIAAGVPAPEVQLVRHTVAEQLAGTKSFGLAIGIAIGTVVLGGSWYWGSRHVSGSHSPVTQSTTLASTMESQSAAPPSAVFDPRLPETPPVSAEPPASATTHGTAAGSPGTLPRATHREASTEAGLLHLARTLLATDPERALRLTKEHARRYPNGDLAQEREVIAIESLRRLGRLDAAVERGAAFERKYPGSVHQSKIEQTLEGQLP